MPPKQSHAKKKGNPDQGSLIGQFAYQELAEWMNAAGTQLYYEIKSEINSPIIVIDLPNVVPREASVSLLEVVISRLEKEGHQLPSMIVHATQ